MLSVLRHPVYARLLTAQVLALSGTGLMTVALGLLAVRLAGAEAGAVLGTALVIKMVAYVALSPVFNALAGHLPRRLVLVSLDVARACVALALPFVAAIWQIYVLIFILQACSAAFTPIFQATIPDILPDEADYTRALSLARVAYDTESLVSPTLAAALLTVMSFHYLFAGTALGFLASAALVVGTRLPPPAAQPRRTIWDRTTRGMRAYLATPRLRGLLALNLAVAAGGATVFVNTAVWVEVGLGRSQSDVALALAVFGGGSMAAALVLPRLLDRLPDRGVMLLAAALIAPLLVAGLPLAMAGRGASFGALMVLWGALGVTYSVVQTPTGRLLRRSGEEADRPALFAAQFALSHACWLIAYGIAGWVGAGAGMGAALLALALLATGGAGAAIRLWPREAAPVVVAARAIQSGSRVR